jgi:hypothetical protein
MKTSIPHHDYLALCGLWRMALDMDAQLKQIIRKAREIVGDMENPRDDGHMGDVMYGARNLDDALRIMKVTVEPKSPAAAVHGFSEDERVATLALIKAAKEHGWPEAEKLVDLRQTLTTR